MKRKIFLISIMLLTLISIIVVIINNIDNKENNIISNVEKNKQIINSNMITMMYETESGSGEYIETKDTTWPESGYIFNDTLSGCENGGELEYNSINNTVNLLNNSSDRCYVYFDKYDGVWIDKVNVTNVTGNSVTLDISATSENGNITTYNYAINDNEEYTEVDSNVITISDLNKLTEYKISIYCLDSINAKSNIYEITVSTTDISVPVINSVSVSNITTSGFTLTVNATSNVDISKYYFIIDSEDIAGVSSNNNYTFNNLKGDTSYNILIYVKDIKGILSNEYNLIAETDNGISLANYIVNNVYTIDGENGLYYHDGQGSYTNADQEAGDNSYRYAGGDYLLTSEARIAGFSSLVTSSNTATNGLINFYCNGSKSYVGAYCSTSYTQYYTTAYNETNKYSTYEDAIISAINNGYLTKDNIKNFVCFGSDAILCPSDNLYRIIGVFDGKVKLIKSTYASNILLGTDGAYSRNNYYKYSTTLSNWSSSDLNLINLNNNYYNSFTSEWQNKINNNYWNINAIGSNQIPKDIFINEIKNAPTKYQNKIGLIYISDYGYAASPINWTTEIRSYNTDLNKSNNWLYLKYIEWTYNSRN